MLAKPAFHLPSCKILCQKKIFTKTAKDFEMLRIQFYTYTYKLWAKIILGHTQMSSITWTHPHTRTHTMHVSNVQNGVTWDSQGQAPSTVKDQKHSL